MQNTNDIEFAAKCIQEGKLVAFPTETVYGLGANALNPLAVAKIFELKERPTFDPLIVHISTIDQLETIAANIDERVYKIAENFWPGPLTMVLPKSSIVPDIVTSGLPTVGVRMPENEMALELITKSNCPIAAPSANKFGRISPTTAAHVRKQLPDVDYVLDGGKTTVGIESTIIRLTSKGFQILRNGIITKEQLEKVVPFDDTTEIEELSAPGMLKSHYSPRKMLLISDSDLSQINKSKAGLISFSGVLEGGFSKVIRVSQTNDLKDYAVNMFEAMHSFEDDSQIELIIAEAVPLDGIGIAIMDRLRKAEYDWKKAKKPRIFNMPFAEVYPLYIQKAEKKGRTKEEVDQIIFWLTGYNDEKLQIILDSKSDFEKFFCNAPQFNTNAHKITGVICGYRVEEIQDALMQKIRYLDKLIDELAKGKAMDKILRK